MEWHAGKVADASILRTLPKIAIQETAISQVHPRTRNQMASEYRQTERVVKRKVTACDAVAFNRQYIGNGERIGNDVGERQPNELRAARRPRRGQEKRQLLVQRSIDGSSLRSVSQYTGIDDELGCVGALKRLFAGCWQLWIQQGHGVTGRHRSEESCYALDVVLRIKEHEGPTTIQSTAPAGNALFQLAVSQPVRHRIVQQARGRAVALLEEGYGLVLGHSVKRACRHRPRAPARS